MNDLKMTDKENRGTGLWAARGDASYARLYCNHLLCQDDMLLTRTSVYPTVEQRNNSRTLDVAHTPADRSTPRCRMKIFISPE